MSLFLTQDVGRAGLVNSPIFFTVSSPGDLAVGLLNKSSRRHLKPPRLLSKLTGTVQFCESGIEENRTNGENLFVRGRVDRRKPSSHCSKSKGRSKSRDMNRVKCFYCGKDDHVKKKCFKRIKDEKLRKQDLPCLRTKTEPKSSTGIPIFENISMAKEPVYFSDILKSRDHWAALKMSLFLTQDARWAELVNNLIFFTVSSQMTWLLVF
ncbi:hypothetical protein M9H77_16435 [Catharanthus roseus]|uniref:Uncharacterized protein n=1 Tax=Catharanthus roseus TaxID=4058 RepID=A0ACC0B1Q7_CATRO|nr:hypothetical protein M9H77_16435 [Catharanthus roseus]